jgi:uncharacterized membrane protein YuzA (DUF378 family)
MIQGTAYALLLAHLFQIVIGLYVVYELSLIFKFLADPSKASKIKKYLKRVQSK